jgi:outer membrane protein assembly factor BamB
MLNPDSEIFFAFTNKLPAKYSENPVLISGRESLHEKNSEYLLLKQQDTIQKVFEIRYFSSGGLYKEAVIFNNQLAVGHYQFFYLFDLVQNINTIRLEVSGYFGHIYIDDNRLFISDAGCIYCFNDKGKMLWQNKILGIDGVFISNFRDEVIVGSGQWDPPDGWKDFVLNKETGYKIG